MDKESREKCIKAGRRDLVEIYDINKAGYAGILPNGMIVDRRKYPKAITVQENSFMGLPKPKEVNPVNQLAWQNVLNKMTILKIKIGYVIFNENEDLISLHRNDSETNSFRVTKEEVQTYINNFNQW